MFLVTWRHIIITCSLAIFLVEAVLTSSAMVLVQQVTKNAKAMVPFLKPIWAFGIAFSVTGYLIWKLPITGGTSDGNADNNEFHQY